MVFALIRLNRPSNHFLHTFSTIHSVASTVFRGFVSRFDPMSLSLCQLPGQQFLRECKAKVVRCTAIDALEMKVPPAMAQGAVR